MEDQRAMIAAQIMCGFITNNVITHPYGGSDVVEIGDGEKNTANQKLNKEINHYTKLSIKIADALLKNMEK